ncbi:MAG: SpoIIE family protein phosphatase [Bacteroidia bacterium]|nr:SpoIIE family protein phosphatase [Bacteroidia bacterium]
MKNLNRVSCFYIVFIVYLPVVAQSGFDRMESLPQKLSAENQLLKNYVDSIGKYERSGKIKEALQYAKLYRQTKDSIMNSENSKIRAELYSRYETQKKGDEIKLLLKNKLIKEKEIAKQKIVLNLVLIGIGVVLLLGLLLLGRYRLIRKLNKKLDAQNDLVIRKNNLIMDSIDYAQRIQQSILPSPEYLKKYFRDIFVIYKPKDVVSGDLYWFREKNNRLWLAAIDCTGHGVPGAMMSMFVYDLLHQCIRLNKLVYPDEILKGMSIGIRQFSNASGETNNIKDGMDIAMCQIDLDTLILRYAGAQNSIYITRGDKIIELSADKVHIGLPEYYDFNFTAHTFQLQKADSVYLFSDGFVDQKGGPDNRKYYVEPFKQLLLKNSSLPAIDQQKNIEEAFLKWKGEQEQVDDIMIIGLTI